ncbi:MAG: CHAT domain-containing protein, partial [Bacteroidota bacterium]
KKSKLEHALGHYESSLAFLTKAMNVVAPQLAETGVKDDITIIGRFSRVLEIIAFRAQVLTSQGQYEAALSDVMLLNRLVTQSRRTYQSSLSKYYLIQEVMPVYELGIQLNHRLYGQTGDPKYLEQAYALNARNKAILLLESLQSDRAMTFAGLPLDVQEEEKTLRDALTEQERLLYSAYQRDQAIDSLQSVVFEHEQAYYQFIQQLERDYPAYYELKYSADQPPQVSEVQMELDGDQALLEYFVGQDSIYTFVMDGANLQVLSQVKPAGLVDSIELFRELLTNGIEDDCETTYIRLGRYFYNLLLATPLSAIGEQKDRLVIIPDGLLNFLSFEALLYKDITDVRKAEGFVLEKYALSYAYSSKLLLEKDFYPRSATKGFAGFGTEYDATTLEYLKDFVYHEWKEADTTWTLPCGQTVDTTRFWGQLAYSDDEVRAISELTQGASWLNEAVTKENFLQNAEGYNLLHLAMHGTYDLDFPMNSSLIFTKGDSSDVFLRAAEIYGMELDGDMVVLSACNTAYGKLQAGEGPMTLARAFHYAGIPSVVASLWSIPDNSTSRIMKLFYEQLDRGLAKDEALQQAKLQYLASDDISSPVTRQPLHWASTIVIGEIEPVSVSPSNFWWWAGGAALGLLLLGMIARGRRA